MIGNRPSTVCRLVRRCSLRDGARPWPPPSELRGKALRSPVPGRGSGRRRHTLRGRFPGILAVALLAACGSGPMVDADFRGEALTRLGMDAPDDPLAWPPERWRRMADLAADLDRPEAELRALVALAAWDPGDLEVLERRVALLEEAGRDEEAARLLEDTARSGAVVGFPRRRLLEDAARIRRRLGQFALAAADLEEALRDLDPEAADRAVPGSVRAFAEGRFREPSEARAVLRLHPDPELRRAAVRWLADRRFPEELPTFVAALADPDPEVVRVAVAELAARTPEEGRGRVAPALLALAGGDDEELALEALDALERLATEAEVPGLLALLATEDRARFRAVRRVLEALAGPGVDDGGGLDPDPARREAVRAFWRAWWQERGGA